jgi:hypothetical protein
MKAQSRRDEIRFSTCYLGLKVSQQLRNLWEIGKRSINTISLNE